MLATFSPRHTNMVHLNGFFQSYLQNGLKYPNLIKIKYLMLVKFANFPNQFLLQYILFC